MGSRSGAAAQDRALEEYVSGEGMWINQYLRGNGDFGELTPAEKQYLADLEKATSQQLGKDYDLYRAADARAVFGNISERGINYQLDRAKKEKEQRDHKLWEAIMQGKAGKEFQQAIEESKPAK